jgi:hypothetical protein
MIHRYTKGSLLTHHSFFKAKVYETDLKNIEPVLLHKVNVQTTVCYVSRNGTDDAALTNQVHRMQRQAPMLFDKVLPKADQAAVAMGGTDALVDDLDQDDVLFVATPPARLAKSHTDISVKGRLLATRAESIHHPINDGEPLPIRAYQFTDTFVGALREAYAKDYSLSHQYGLHTKNPRIQWSKKIGFTDR